MSEYQPARPLGVQTETIDSASYLRDEILQARLAEAKEAGLDFAVTALEKELEKRDGL